MVVNTYQFREEYNVAELKVSVQSFAQAIQYAVDCEPPCFGDIAHPTRKYLQSRLSEILECQDLNKKFRLDTPVNAQITIVFTEPWLRAAANHANTRAAYFGLLTREPKAAGCVTSAAIKRHHSNPA
jgi:hypothetical protein